MIGPKPAAVAVLALAACTSAAPPTTVALNPRIVVQAMAAQPDRAPSWFSSDAGSGPLLYVSDLYNFDVYVYTVPSLKLVGRLSGFWEPQGECSDTQGDVWIADTGDQQMLEFKPGDVKPIAQLADTLGYPASCAIDAHTGNLAVTNVFGVSGTGAVLVYPQASGTPAVYVNPKQHYYFFDGYDSRGDLYASGMTSNDAYSLSVLPSAGKKMSSVSVTGGTLYYPGVVFASGSSLVLGDQQCKDAKTSCLYQASVSGTRASLTKEIPLTGSCGVAQVALTTGELFGGNYNYCSKERSSTDRWAYPAGGKPSDAVTGVRQPVGAAISSN